MITKNGGKLSDFDLQCSIGWFFIPNSTVTNFYKNLEASLLSKTKGPSFINNTASSFGHHRDPKQ